MNVTPKGEKPSGSRFGAFRALRNAISDATKEVRLVFADDLSIEDKIYILKKDLKKTSPGHPHRLIYLISLSGAFWVRYNTTKEEADLDECIQFTENGLEETSGDYQRRVDCLTRLADCFRLRYERSGALEDLDTFLRRAKEAADETSSDTSNHPYCLRLLGGALLDRYKRFGQLADLEYSVKCAQEAVNMVTEKTKDRAVYLTVLADALIQRYRKCGRLVDLDEAIRIRRHAVAIASTGESGDLTKAQCLGRLGMVLRDRYERFNQLEDLQEAVKFSRQALDAAPLGSSGRPFYFHELAAVLVNRYKRLGVAEDLERAMEYGHQAFELLPVVHSNRPSFLSLLGALYHAQYERLGLMDDLDRSIDYAQQALDSVPADHADRPSSLISLCLKLSDRYERTEQPQDIEQAIKSVTEVLAQTANDHPQRGGWLNILGTAYFRRFMGFGDVDDLEKFIECSLNALGSVAVDHADRSLYLQNLAAGLSNRFFIMQQASDVDQAITLNEEALGLIPADSQKRLPCLMNIGSLYSQRSRLSVGVADCDLAIRYLQEAVNLVPKEHEQRPMHLHNLGSAYHLRYEKCKRVGDLEQAIKYAQEAIEATGISYPDRKRMFSLRLGKMYRSRFQLTEQVGDLRQAIHQAQEALEETPSSHPERSMYLMELGSYFDTLFGLTELPEDHKEAYYAFKEAYKSAHTPLLRLTSALQVVVNLAMREEWAEASRMIEESINILPNVITPSKSREDSMKILQQLSEISALSADVYLNAGRSPMEALMALESYQGVIASLMIDAKSDVSLLKEDHPDLWSRYTQCREQIASMGANNLSALGSEAGSEQSYVAQSRRNQQLYKTLNHLRDEIRKCSGFERFLLPPTETQIQHLAHDGPIVCYNISRLNSNAFLIREDGVDIVSLPNITRTSLENQVMIFNHSANAARRDADISDDEEEETEEGTVVSDTASQLIHLWEDAVKPVLERLGMLEEKVLMEDLPKIWWVGGGIMSLLPLHAAGIHEPGSRENTLSHVISSYVPTLKTLNFVRSRPSFSASATSHRVLLVSMPVTPGGHQPLRTAEETTAITETVKGSAAVTHLSRPSRDAVLEALGSCSVAHFACHGTSNPIEPAKSSLILGRDVEERLTINDISNKLINDGAQIAYLSACSTAELKSQKLVHETIHLASTFQLAGFQHVVGTLWGAEDNAAVEIAERFYEKLFGGESVASALHQAVVQFRAKGSNCTEIARWAPFIHLGC